MQRYGYAAAAQNIQELTRATRDTGRANSGLPQRQRFSALF
jgi:hypothetical protein